MGQSCQKCRNEIRGFHHQAPRRVLYVRLEIHRLQNYRQRLSLPHQPEARRNQRDFQCIPERRIVDWRLFLETRLAQQRLLVATVSSARPQCELRSGRLSRTLEQFCEFHPQPGDGNLLGLRKDRPDVVRWRLGTETSGQGCCS